MNPARTTRAPEPCAPVLLPADAVPVHPRRRARLRLRSEDVAEVVLSALTVVLAAFIATCLRHAVDLCAVRFLP